VDSDDTILIAGQISISSSVTKLVVRLFNDGTLDPDFDAGSLTANRAVNKEVLPNGKIVVGPTVKSINGFQAATLARLHPDGTEDLAFDPGAGLGPLMDPGNEHLFALADGKILVTGEFKSVNELPLPMIARLNGDLEFRITEMQKFERGKVQLTSTSRKGKKYMLQTSVDFKQWTVLGSYTASGKVLETEFIPMADESHRYYRIMQAD